jgi:hypothetical protein
VVVVVWMVLLVWVLNADENLVGGMAWLVVRTLLLDALLPAPAAAEHGHEPCRLVPIHPVLTFLKRLKKWTELHIQDFTQNYTSGKL